MSTWDASLLVIQTLPRSSGTFKTVAIVGVRLMMMKEMDDLAQWNLSVLWEQRAKNGNPRLVPDKSEFLSRIIDDFHCRLLRR
jgi:hypothetical protein